ncbi:MAG: hypothetical protein ABJC04_09540 [Verrucomicrobiota bacterium]
MLGIMQTSLSKFWQGSIPQIMILAVTSFFIGCGKAPDFSSLKGYKQPPDTDVSSDIKYNFSSFVGTVWKTKVNVALADLKQYTGQHDLNLLIPKHYDPTHPEYTPATDMQIIAVLPIGTRVRIDRLMRDNGNWGGLRVTAILEDGTNSQKTVFLERMLLSNNQFIARGPTSSTNWDVNPDMLEKP